MAADLRDLILSELRIICAKPTLYGHPTDRDSPITIHTEIARFSIDGNGDLASKNLSSKKTSCGIEIKGEISGNGHMYGLNAEGLIHPITLTNFYNVKDARELTAQTYPSFQEITLERLDKTIVAYIIQYGARLGVLTETGNQPRAMYDEQAVKGIVGVARKLRLGCYKSK